MSSRHLPRVISGRGKSQLELEREQFEKHQTVAINKAINTQETPVKEKHLRNTILGTFTDHGGELFWHVTTRLPLQANPIVCWKFCHVFHKLLQEGHPNNPDWRPGLALTYVFGILYVTVESGYTPYVLTDSQKYITYFDELGKLWGHLRDGYGRLIAQYTALINQILTFHKKNPEIPGNLMLVDDKFARICGSDVNNYFEISVDLLDYMDEVLHLQHIVFASLDMSRSNSMTSSGQCRLAPLILCILDSCQLYDFIVKSLFKLHSSLPPDTLSGHRDRFLSQYKRLKQFYFNSSNLQYFKNLVQVPLLPADPPNFLIQSDFSKHVTPVVVVPEPESEPDRDPDTDSVEDLIDTSDPPQEDRFDAAFGNNLGGFNFSGGPNDVDERDELIEQLKQRIQQLQAQLEQVKAEDEHEIAGLRRQLHRLETEMGELRGAAHTTHADMVALQQQLDQANVHVGAAGKLTETEKHSKANEDRFKKMKDVYQKLRDEHIVLLRQHADATKQLGADKKSLEEKEQIIKDGAADVVRLEAERQLIQTSLQQSADDVTQQLGRTVTANTDLMAAKQNLESQLKSIQSERDELQSQLGESKEQATSFESQLTKARSDAASVEQQSTDQLADLQGRHSKLQADHDTLESSLRQQLSTLQARLSETESSKVATEMELKAQTDELQQSLDKLALDKQQSESQLTSQKNLESQLKSIQSERDELQSQLGESKEQATSFESQLTKARSDAASVEQQSTDQLADLQGRHSKLQADHDTLESSLRQQLSTLQARLSETESSKVATEMELKAQTDELQQSLDKLALDKQQSESQLTSQKDELIQRLLSGSIAEGRAFIEDALGQFENHLFTGVRCPAEFLLTRGGPVLQDLVRLTDTQLVYSSQGTDVEKMVEYITSFSHLLADCVMYGLATSQSSAQIESGQALSNLCRAAGEGGLALLDSMKNGGSPSAAARAAVVDSVEGMMRLAAELVPRTDDVKLEEIGNMVDNEMVMTSKAIELAAAKIQEVLQKARESSSGVHLEVNERILDTCTDLMKAIKILVERSRDLQQEIVVQGRGTSTAKDFYKKNHRWTEGFISAAKAVGWGATTLMEAADKVVRGEGKLEMLIVCSQEIAASTAQLVVSSRVKSKRNSSTLMKLQEASKSVSTATGSVVASVKTGAQIIEDRGLMDFSHLSLIQTKKQEMDSQVRFLELERELELERRQLGQLRKQHYQLAAETEGIEEELEDYHT